MGYVCGKLTNPRIRGRICESRSKHRKQIEEEEYWDREAVADQNGDDGYREDSLYSLWYGLLMR